MLQIAALAPGSAPVASLAGQTTPGAVSGAEAERHLLVPEGRLERGPDGGVVRHRVSGGLPAPRDWFASGAFPYTTTLLRICYPAESWGLESARVLRFCGDDPGLRGRNECQNLSPKGQFSPRPGTRGVLAPGHSALKYIELSVLYRTVSWRFDWVGWGTGSESPVPGHFKSLWHHDQCAQG